MQAPGYKLQLTWDLFGAFEKEHHGSGIALKEHITWFLLEEWEAAVYQ